MSSLINVVYISILCLIHLFIYTKLGYKFGISGYEYSVVVIIGSIIAMLTNKPNNSNIDR